MLKGTGSSPSAKLDSLCCKMINDVSPYCLANCQPASNDCWLIATSFALISCSITVSHFSFSKGIIWARIPSKKVLTILGLLLTGSIDNASTAINLFTFCSISTRIPEVYSAWPVSTGRGSSSWVLTMTVPSGDKKGSQRSASIFSKESRMSPSPSGINGEYTFSPILT